MTVIETPRLVLRPFTPDDAAAHGRLYADPEVTRWLAGGPFLGADASARSRRALARFAEHWTTRGFGVWAVVERASGEVIGQCGLNQIPDLPEIEVLYALARPAWGRGYASEAAAAAVRHGFDVVGLARIVAVVLPANGASRRVLERVGLTHQGQVVVYGGITAEYYVIDRPA